MKPRLAAAILFSVTLLSPAAHAHQQPTTLGLFDITPNQVTLTLHLPVPELELALGHSVSVGPELRTYLLQHIRPGTSSQRPSRPNPAWTVDLLRLRLEATQQFQSGPFQELIATLLLTPPSGESTRHFTLGYDVILHQVVTHKAIFSVRHDWAAGKETAEPVQVAVLRVNTETNTLPPLRIDLREASSFEGFAAMVTLGMNHIKDGPDHILFLLVLLLPSTLLPIARANRTRRWGTFAGITPSLTRVLKLVTAFTLGHSLTLLLGASGWLNLPQQPIEVLIAFTILVSAIHALRPVFPGRENYVAATFGLIHGMAFAAGLADLRLPAVPLAISVFGFNLGIELMQLFVLALTLPWFIGLSLTRFHTWFRIPGALLACLTALAWIADRVTGQTNPIAQAMEHVTAFAPAGILLLALLTGLATLGNSASRRQLTSASES